MTAPLDLSAIQAQLDEALGAIAVEGKLNVPQQRFAVAHLKRTLAALRATRRALDHSVLLIENRLLTCCGLPDDWEAEPCRECESWAAQLNETRAALALVRDGKEST